MGLPRKVLVNDKIEGIMPAFLGQICWEKDDQYDSAGETFLLIGFPKEIFGFKVPRLVKQAVSGDSVFRHRFGHFCGRGMSAIFDLGKHFFAQLSAMEYFL